MIKIKFKQNLEVLYERAKIGIKKSNEYKINFYMMNSFDLINVTMYMFFYSLLLTVIGDILNWQISDFLLYWILMLLGWKMIWFHNFRELPQRLLRGELNKHLTRPINTYFLTSIENFSGNNLISLIYIIPIMLFLIFINNYEYYFLGVFFILFSWIYFMVFHSFVQSFSFFIKKQEFLEDGIFLCNNAIFKFTPKFFENFSIYEFLLILPASVTAYLVIETLKGNFAILMHILPYLIISFIIFILGIILMWHFGLKKYEAFN